MDVIQIAAEFLKIDSALVMEYTSKGPLEAVFYLFFFPTVFLLLFVYTLMGAKGPARADLKLLVTVSIYAFIIMSGYFTWFVWASRWWLYLMLIFGVWYMYVAHKSRGSIDTAYAGAGGQGAQGLQRNAGSLSRDWVKLPKMEKEIYEKINDLRNLVRHSSGAKGGVLDVNIKSVADSIEEEINRYENISLSAKLANSFGRKNKADEMRRALSKARTGS